MFKLLKKLRKKDFLLILVCAGLIVFQVWLDLKLPDYMSEITQLVQTEGNTMAEILTAGGKMLLCAFGSLAAAVIVGFFASYIAATFSKIIRKDIFEKVENFSEGEVKKFSTSSLITRTTNDVSQIEMLVAMGLQLIIKAPITAIWAVSKILGKSLTWSAVIGGGVLILLLTLTFLMIVVLPKFKIVQKLLDKINGITRENLTGIRVVRAFNAEDYQEKKFEETNSKLTKIQLFNQRTFGIMQPIMYLIMYFSTLAIYFIGAYVIDASLMSDKITIFGDMVVFSSYGMQVIMSFLMLAMIFIMYPRAAISADRINEVLDEDFAIKDGSVTKSDPKLTGTVEFRDVSFKYPDADEYILKDITFKAEKGQTIAFIGSTGSGKSTLINLIPRFYDVTDGEIIIDGVNVKDYKLEYLHNKIGYIPQKAVIFSGSVSENVSYGESSKKITKDNVVKAIEVAQGKEFVESMPDKYDAYLAQRGTNISGGQKQRISIARAIARRPEIYIFDDSFSALDYKTDFTLRRELKKYTKDATTFIVAQRIGTIMNADKIIVLDKGTCVGMGTHEELLKNCDVYKEIALSQLSEEELNNA